ncbi:hypothetical protein AA0472_2566 [Acetobacter estunensis NRIC 0472]|uniref:hypothetical protein n=1 Tax=Acetobacter estunensis TaxID=104097 RepID=UPI001F54B20A|nr:hypothetical protein [Acetobacter estunensis]GBQ28020.1 hypothetical protein AA0472_2566 [Acetobacter estunensis NRIC 0472]
MTAETHKKPGLETLRAAISRLEGHSDRRHTVLPFGVREIHSRQAVFAPSFKWIELSAQRMIQHCSCSAG